MELALLDDDRHGLGSSVDDLVVGATEAVITVTAYSPFAFPEAGAFDDDGFTDDEVERNWTEDDQRNACDRGRDGATS